MNTGTSDPARDSDAQPFPGPPTTAAGAGTAAPATRRVGRRRFLGKVAALSSGMAAGRLTAAAPPSAPAATDGVFTVTDQKPWANQTRRLKITHGRSPVASLIFPTDYPTHFRLKPELHHVCTPRGFEVTGSHEYCFIHHMSINCGHGKVQMDGDSRIVDFYRHLPFPDSRRRDPHRPENTTNNLFQLGPSGIQKITASRWRGGERVVIGLQLAWQTREVGREDGDVMALEERYYAISRAEGANVVDLYSRLSPATRPVTLVPENDHGYLALRVHDFIDPDDGGTMIDSEGRNPNGHFRYNSQRWVPKGGTPAPFGVVAKSDGPRPRWVDCTGRIGDATAGITLMSHPANPKNEWYAREFGVLLISAAQTVPVRITAEEPFVFAARYISHDGPLDVARTNRLHEAFARSSPDDCLRYIEG